MSKLLWRKIRQEQRIGDGWWMHFTEWLGRAPPRSKVSGEVTISHVDFWGKRVPSRVNRKCTSAWLVEEQGALSVGVEGAKEVSGSRGPGRDQSLVGCCADFGFDSKRDGESPRRSGVM